MNKQEMNEAVKTAILDFELEAEKNETSWNYITLYVDLTDICEKYAEGIKYECEQVLSGLNDEN